MSDSDILPIREALTKLDEVEPGAVPDEIWIMLGNLEDATYQLWARHIMDEVKEARSTTDENRKRVRERLKELSKKNA